MNPNGQNGYNTNRNQRNTQQPGEPLVNTYGEVNRKESYNPNNFFNPTDLNTAPNFAPQPQTYQQILNQQQQQYAQRFGMTQQQFQQQIQPTPMMPAPQPTVAPVQKKGHALEIALIVFIFLIGAGAIAGAAYCQSQFSTLNANVMTDRSKRVDDAKAAQKILDDQAYENRNASNTKEFTGPSDFGAITFKYPKSWKVYLENNDDSNPTYTAYFSPEYVPPTSGSYSFALSFKIVNQEYNKYLQTLDQRKLISTQPWNNPNNTLTGSKITGKLDEKTEQPNGSEIVIRVNNYTAIVRTDDYDKYGEDYDEIIATLDSANQ